MRKFKVSNLDIINLKYSPKSNAFHLLGKGGVGSLNINKLVLAKRSSENKFLFFFSDKSSSQNMLKSFPRIITGLNAGYFSELILRGVGFRVYFLNSAQILLNLGYSHYLIYKLPSSVISFIKKGKIFLYSLDRQVLGSVVSDLKNLRIADPYKAKGIVENGQMFSIKEGKKR